MTTITAEDLVQQPEPQPRQRPALRSVASFLAGAALASAAAVGINAAVDDPAPRTGTPALSAQNHASHDAGCLVLRGPC
jgi:hypothetical protein